MEKADFLMEKNPVQCLSYWGMRYKGRRYKPCCIDCRKFNVERLPGPFKTKEGKIFLFLCKDCEKPVDLGMQIRI